ncbi:hypothetical protein LTR93_008770 [Exophiala xenobiotica]|nr:hypothetical protein LTR93_008770 [Exophiala xenobiotica]
MTIGNGRSPTSPIAKPAFEVDSVIPSRPERTCDPKDSTSTSTSKSTAPAPAPAPAQHSKPSTPAGAQQEDNTIENTPRGVIVRTQNTAYVIPT